MPVNQPTQYIQRGPRNYVNISGAILTPFAQGLGEVASQGFKPCAGRCHGVLGGFDTRAPSPVLT